MEVKIKKMETDAEIRGKACVHWKSWQEAYDGIGDREYLRNLTLEKCVGLAYRRTDNIIIAKDGEKVVGFAGYGRYRSDALSDAGEVFALYVLAEYWGQGIGYRLMQEALRLLAEYSMVAVWVLKDNIRAVRFYERCGFCFDGREEMLQLGSPVKEVRMILKR